MSTVPGGKVPVMCPSCSKKLMVPQGTLGKQGRCPGCQTVFTLEEMYEAELSPVASPALSPISNPSAGLTPIAPGSLYSDDDFGGDYNLAPSPPTMHNGAYAPPAYSATHQPFPNNSFNTPGLQNTGFSPPGYGSPYSSPAPAQRQGFEFNSSILGGLLMMVGAVVWFFGAGLLLNVWFIYPPILFIFGLIAFFKGIFSGNLAGE
jgi:hypothetical protein